MLLQKGKAMEFVVVPQERRSPKLIEQLVGVWERSVRATHLFLTEEDILRIKEYVPQAMAAVDTLMVAEDDGASVAFMGVHEGVLEMLFIDPAFRGRGFGKRLLSVGVREYDARELSVNEQNPQAVGFYKHLGYEVFKRTECDEQGDPFPLLYMRLPEDAPAF